MEQLLLLVFALAAALGFLVGLAVAGFFAAKQYKEIQQMYKQAADNLERMYKQAADNLERVRGQP